MSQPLVSIALCTYNGEQYLKDQLNSLLDQTYTNIEIIIVDDNSTDSTWSILNQFALLDSRIKIFKNNQNLGFTKNFESAIARTSGHMIAPSDQDDIWAANKIELLMEELNDNLLVYCNSEFVDQNNISLNKYMSDLRNMYSGGDAIPFMRSNCISGHAMLFKRELIKHSLPFPPKIYYDWWIAFNACNSGKVKYINKSLVRYRQHSNNITDTSGRKKNENRNELVTKHYLWQIEWLSFILSISKLKNRSFFESYYLYYKNSAYNKFNWNLWVISIMHFKTIYALEKIKFFSAVNRLRKECFSNSRLRRNITLVKTPN